ncbi:MAG: nitrous oxide reductase accessory protein NosL [Maribacter sp.]|nr:nitrous oxide reductase accessory protein NosL [Maribacter sp.]
MCPRIFFWSCCFVLLGSLSCSIRPQPINYGLDACHYCSMTIVDQQHAAQIVTDKGKAFKFDASECMLNYLNEIDTNEVALFMVDDYNTPGELLDATKATFFISKDLPSPMGEFLSAFASKEAAQRAQAEHQGELFTWEEMQSKFKK